MHASKLLFALGLTAGVHGLPDTDSQDATETIRIAPKRPSPSQKSAVDAAVKSFETNGAESDHWLDSVAGLSEEQIEVMLEVKAALRAAKAAGAVAGAENDDWQNDKREEADSEICWPGAAGMPTGDCPGMMKDTTNRRDTNDLAMLQDDWTRWACTRGVQWACMYPEFDERDTPDDSDEVCPRSNSTTYCSSD